MSIFKFAPVTLCQWRTDQNQLFEKLRFKSWNQNHHVVHVSNDYASASPATGRLHEYPRAFPNNSRLAVTKKKESV